MEYFIVSLGVASIATQLFKLQDIVVDLGEFHAAIL